jgi:hypothetical protein
MLRKAPQMHETVVQRQVGDIAHVAIGIAEASVDACELSLTDKALRGAGQMFLKYCVQRAQAHLRLIGQCLSTDTLFQVAVDVFDNSFEGISGGREVFTSYISLHQRKHFSGDDVGVMIL